MLLLFHGLCALVYAYTLYFDYWLTLEFKLQLPIPNVYPSKLVWLTMTCVVIQLLYHVIAAVVNLNNNRSRKANDSTLLRQFDFYATTIVFPLAITVCVLFWGLFFFDPNTLMDEQAKKVLSINWWFNHALHTFPSLAMIVDLVCSRHRRPSKNRAFVTILAFLCIYLSWVHFVFYGYGFWAYPILGQLNLAMRTVFLLFCTVVIFSIFLIGDALNAMLGQTSMRKPAPRHTKKVR
ncbi:FAR-17a/AIG1-like protein [Ditylenchus destructor]|nr:FAR-17a/AIG1-like protein [Ditylenchus destructor]